MKKIRVLIVDDSLFMRRTLTRIISNEQIEVIDTAVNGKEGVEKALALKPDVITMDIEMPVMTGLEALKIIMDKMPTPILMVSTLTSEGAEATVEALSNGAMDFITKRSAFTEMHSLKDELIDKIVELGSSPSIKTQLMKRKLKSRYSGKYGTDHIKPTTGSYQSNSLTGRAKPKASNIGIVAIGISTGGPVALHEVIPNLPKEFPVPIVIAQHMPPYFTKTLADRLNSKSQLCVKEAEDNERLQAGCCYIAPGGKIMTISRWKKIMISDEPSTELFKPSVNVLVDSVNNVYDGNAVAVIMTGMGSDGAEAMAKLHGNGGYVISQSPESCVVPGMPNSVIKRNAVDEIIPLANIAEYLASLFNLTK